MCACVYVTEHNNVYTVLSIKLKFNMCIVDYHSWYYIYFGVWRRYSFFTGYTKCPTIRLKSLKCLNAFEHYLITWNFTHLVFDVHLSLCMVIIGIYVHWIYKYFAVKYNLFMYYSLFWIYIYWNTCWLKHV